MANSPENSIRKSCQKGDLTRTQVGYLNVTAGTSAASKAVVLDASSKISAIDITALKIGGTSVTATAAELNELDGIVASFTFAPAAGASNVCDVVITAKDAAGATVASPRPFMVWLSDAATGVAPSAVTTSGTVTAKAASGVVMGTLTAKQSLIVQPLATGIFTLEITDSAKTLFYVCASTLDGRAFSVSAKLTTANYG